jgi:hypothetical protein
MVIDTELATVTFTKNETLTVERLGDVIKVLQDLRLDGLSEWERELLYSEYAVYVFSIRSESDFDSWYAVTVYSNGSWTCGCPDFINRNKKETGETCKHIRKVQLPRR